MIYYSLITKHELEEWLKSLPFIISVNTWYPEHWSSEDMGKMSIMIGVPWYILWFGKKRFEKYIMYILKTKSVMRMTFTLYFV